MVTVRCPRRRARDKWNLRFGATHGQYSRRCQTSRPKLKSGAEPLAIALSREHCSGRRSRPRFPDRGMVVRVENDAGRIVADDKHGNRTKASARPTRGWDGPGDRTARAFRSRSRTIAGTENGRRTRVHRGADARPAANDAIQLRLPAAHCSRAHSGNGAQRPEFVPAGSRKSRCSRPRPRRGRS
jgi:hypothetical protein